MAAEGSTLKVEDLEEGKRYKVTFEGVWDGRWLSARKGSAAFFGGSKDGSLHFASFIEKLPDPEPKWKHGTVVRVPYCVPFTWVNRNWHIGPINGGDGYRDNVSKAWKAGTLEILYQPSE